MILYRTAQSLLHAQPEPQDVLMALLKSTGKKTFLYRLESRQLSNRILFRKPPMMVKS